MRPARLVVARELSQSWLRGAGIAGVDHRAETARAHEVGQQAEVVDDHRRPRHRGLEQHARERGMPRVRKHGAARRAQEA